ncbi:alpha/beta hydrolase [Pukyongiella litopenaei]|nr:alpha/beta hydrolase [Pukyongiella litopenaei]
MSKARILGQMLLAKLPAPVVGMVYSGRLAQVDGRRIDPKAQAIGDLINAVRDPAAPQTLEDSRAGIRKMCELFDLPCPDAVTKTDILLPGAAGDRPARIYDAVQAGHDGLRPTLLYLHGGGWVQGDLDTHDGLCGRLALWAEIRVVSYDYRLAPEHKYPAAADDVLAVFSALRDRGGDWGVDAARLAVGGDSAGANLTAGLLHDLAGLGAAMPAAQLLIYPGVDISLDSRSMVMLADAYVLTAERIRWYLDFYFEADADRRDPRASPILSDRLAGQPPALVIAAGHDPLWDDALGYAAKLREAGGEVDLLEYPGQVHGFMSLTRTIPQGLEATRAAADWLRRQIGG